ncbi:SDR family oxidoreductase [Prolixibacter denitrificans]|uniref:NAD(P)-dependent dehydrogenase (Short-subunit alcohol dehydrogenase family) n=1 Tax=Prolixibacter denitrificans TaxID=1541063 RepID=A0A2P8CKI4_9BACT|nr:SDR family oxidoreductase [Prolixibacter denitrificans]PSK85486.1 NAD(P)-dependent dehydrogenase (short-subunit alcohol dehydrogenase family) [Prolixibacter denitrificans]GET20106.1 oxidoreductase [Prolixibacter denitrificans]
MKQKVVVVTGGAQGIGRGIAEKFLKEGWKVVIWEVDDEAGREMKEQQNSDDFAYLLCNVAHEAAVRSAVQKTVSLFGRIDVLVNNAAVAKNKPVTELSLEEWQHVIDVNLNGPFLCSKYCAGELKKNRGVIINLCSTRAFQSEPDTEAYSASKGGVYALTHSLAMSLGPEVRVNSISPGWIDVSALKKKSVASEEKLTKEDHWQHPAGRVGKVEDIAAMAFFLAQSENSFITGQNFVVDGGMTRKMIYL